MKINKIAFLILTQLVIYGCSDDKDLDCNSDSNKQLALQIIDNNLMSARWYQEMKPNVKDEKIENIKTLSIDDKIGSTSCGANYTFTYNDTNLSKEFIYELSWLQDKKITEVSLDPSDIKAHAMAAGMTIFKKSPPKPTIQQTPPVSSQIEDEINNAPPLTDSQQHCVDSKIDAYHKENGDDAMIAFDQTGEWEDYCRAQ